ncbi:MAG: energy-coupling factor transporter transmembrane component T [Candidatus Choladocola sp.]|nr:energy-coupling factor transporter transmembrane component T [Candidatus Choladocola sp.]
MRDCFSAYHPAINFIFFLGAMICGMILLHPGYLACSVFLSFTYYLTLQKEKGLRFIFGMVSLFCLLSLINPVFNTYGETVLFVWPGGRPYTREALYYGMALAAMMISVLAWFASWQIVMTSDKFLYLFGHLAPAATLTLTMIFRLIPSYRKKEEQIGNARKCIGMDADTGNTAAKAAHGMVIVSALMSWALEGGIVTADSMRSRGYGCGKRTHFSRYRFAGRDKALLGFMVFLLAAVILCGMGGGAAVVFTPRFEMAGRSSPWFSAGIFAYFLFLFIPSAINILEEIRWHSLRSEI